MEEKLKENKCFVQFVCVDCYEKECYQFTKEKSTNGCKYLRGVFCDNVIAQVNAMVIELKRMGLKVDGGLSSLTDKDLEKFKIKLSSLASSKQSKDN